MYCLFCGSKGGFVNRLLISPLDDRSAAIAECEFCSANLDTELMRWILKAQRDGDL